MSGGFRGGLGRCPLCVGEDHGSCCFRFLIGGWSGAVGVEVVSVGVVFGDRLRGRLGLCLAGGSL